MKKYFIFALAALALGFAACNDKNEPSSKSEGSITVNPSSKTVSGSGETFSVEITSSSAWTATTDQPSWVSLNPLAGAGDAYVSITVSAGGEGTANVKFANASGKSATLTIVREAGSSAPGALSGEFSVSETTKVHFSKGNLQYVGTWQLAENQWDYFGESQSDNHRDLFGWGTGNNPNNVSTDYNDYATYTEWGNNPISNGGNKANQWRTLTKDEWVYLFYGRTNAATKFGLGSVNGVNGTILLPDNWTLPAGASFTASTTQGLADQGTYYYNESGNNFSHNTYTAALWKTMEDNGAVFLPAAGGRYGTDVSHVGSRGYYWSSTPDGEYSAYDLYFSSSDLFPQNYYGRYDGLTVRLVR